VKTFLIWLFIVVLLCGLLGAFMSQMPGDSFPGSLPALTEDQQSLAETLSSEVDDIANDTGTRGPHQQANMNAACDYLHSQLHRAGYDVRDLPFDSKGFNVNNLEVSLTGSRRPDDVIVIAAHYDSDAGSPGADANASGCAVLVELARAMVARPCERTIRFVLFANGAGPLAGDDKSGAAHYAREARKKGEKIVAMLSLDSLGVYRDTGGSQSLPFPLSLAYPSAGNFVMFAGDFGSRDLVRTCVREFRKGARFPSEGLAAPRFVSGLAASDDTGFRAQDFPAIVVTDTGLLRSDKTTTRFDTTERLDYARMARVTAGLLLVVQGLGQHGTLL
jgi:hypothetical protein